ncbi:MULTISPECIES: hypothetical protein [Listeria]|uniref:hypothetical protein n=1 Tax=Listeria TaxID=1637 RepID=UPI000B588058|nr:MULTISPECIES: hypothetical protein [Listeria]
MSKALNQRQQIYLDLLTKRAKLLNQINQAETNEKIQSCKIRMKHLDQKIDMQTMLLNSDEIRIVLENSKWGLA